MEPTNYLLLTVNTTNGVVTVTFQTKGEKTNTVAHGAVLQNQTNALGAFPGTSQTGSFILHSTVARRLRWNSPSRRREVSNLAHLPRENASDSQGDLQRPVTLSQGLSRVVAAWGKLPAALKAAILAIVDAGTNKGGQ